MLLIVAVFTVPVGWALGAYPDRILCALAAFTALIEFCRPVGLAVACLPRSRSAVQADVVLENGPAQMESAQIV